MNQRVEQQRRIIGDAVFNSIDLAKLFFIYVIVVFHSRLLDGIVNHGYIGVEFFFIVSGFFLQKSVLNSSKNVFAYAKRRIEKLYPHYIFSFAVMLIGAILMGNYVKEDYCCIAEIFMVQNLGFTRGGVNYPCWYLSVLFWESLVLFSVLKYIDKRIHTVILLVLPVLYWGYSIIFAEGRAEIWNTVHGIYLPLLRGLADLSMGILVYRIYIFLSEKRLYNYKTMLRIVEVISFLVIVLLVMCSLPLDVISVLLMCIFILATLSDGSVFEYLGKNKNIKQFSKFEYAIFLNHAVVVMFFQKYLIGNVSIRVSVLLLILLISVTVYSFLTTRLILSVRKVAGRLCNKWEFFGRDYE